MPYKDKQKQKDAQRKHYLKNKLKYQKSIKKRRLRNKKLVHKIKGELGCKSCDENNPECLDFHHKNPKLKNDTVAQLIHDAASIQRIEEEIKLCQVLCSNCHNKQHRPRQILDGSSWQNFNKARVNKRKWFIDYITKQKCYKCNEDDTRCLEHHHVGKKNYSISYLLTSGHSLQVLQDEIALCIVLCSNCHRKEHGKV